MKNEEYESQVQWRNLALQFDRHRIKAMALIRAVAEGRATIEDCAKFAALPPPDAGLPPVWNTVSDTDPVLPIMGEEVLLQLGDTFHLAQLDEEEGNLYWSTGIGEGLELYAGNEWMYISDTRRLNHHLIEAVKPFAQCTDQIAPEESDSEWAKFLLLIGDYRRAQAALSGSGEKCRPVLGVWFGSHPESTGAENWTVMLHRLGQNIMDSGAITIKRTEYKDRARYEADRLRYLIGELDTEPDIMAYDAELISDYGRKLRESSFSRGPG